MGDVFWGVQITCKCKGGIPSETFSEISIKSSVSTLEAPGTLHDIVTQVKVKRKKPIHKKDHLSNKWQPEELNMLLKLLNVYGTDFGMIALHMKKTRDQIKRKYILLGPKYEQRLNIVLKGEQAVDMQTQKKVEEMAKMDDLY